MSFSISDAPTGEISVNEIAELRKALEAGYGTNSPDLTGAGAMRVQSLDPTLHAVLQSEDDFTLFNLLVKNSADATVDEWLEQSGIGGFIGGSTNTEAGVISEASGQYNRRVGFVKYLQTRCQISFVAGVQKSHVDMEAREDWNGAMRLLTDADYLCYAGDSSVVPTEFDGIDAQMSQGVAAGQVDDDNIIDLKGNPLNDIAAFASGARPAAT